MSEAEAWRAPWAGARWEAPPAAVERDGDDLLVTAVEGSDAWRTTAYGFVHDDAHALLAPLADGQAVEVRFSLDYDQQFDQAGVLVRAAADQWVKAGVEHSDGSPQVGAVVTRGVSDWSVAPVPEWAERDVEVRASRSGDALVVRARPVGGEWRLVRMAPLDPALDWRAGPYCCAPTRAGLVVRFRDARLGPADPSLH